jgi:ribosomal protein S18 acetylase RimI-like enzyme
MRLACLHDRDEIEAFLRRNTFLHIYSIGDLDDYFWENTVWYALKDGEEIKEVLLVYTPLAEPVLVGLSEEPAARMPGLLELALPLLPRRIYAHLSLGLAEVLAGHYAIRSHGPHYKMALTDTARLERVDTFEVEALSASDLPDLQKLYAEAYPDTAFEPSMLAIGHYYGVRRGPELVGVGGLHVYSARYRVAAIGNVATHPRYRGQGIATAICARLCRELLRTVDHVGLNVKADNASAVASYERLGFESIATFEELSLELK